MILFAALGFAVQAWLPWPPGLAVGLLAGFVIANLVPAKGASCALPARRAPEAPPGEPPTP